MARSFAPIDLIALPRLSAISTARLLYELRELPRTREQRLYKQARKASASQSWRTNNPPV
jgi:hypothetical protein